MTIGKSVAPLKNAGTSLSRVILDAILLAYIVTTGLLSMIRDWDSAQSKAIGMMAMAASTLNLLNAKWGQSIFHQLMQQ